MAAERTLIMVKPDAVSRGLIGQVLSRFELKGFKFVAMELLRFDSAKAKEFYAPHVGKPFFPELEKFITSGYLLAAVLEGNYAVDVVRRMIGATKSYEAAAGTVRGDFSLGITDNIVHASDSVESYLRESKILFPKLG